MIRHSDAIRLAEASDWTGLQRLVCESPHVARECDDYGMLPIHWACTERDVPIDLLDDLLTAYPLGIRTKNKAELLPIHIAVRAKATCSWLKRLLDTYPESIMVETPHRETPRILAEDANLSPSGLKLLAEAEENFMKLMPEDEWNQIGSNQNKDESPVGKNQRSVSTGDASTKSRKLSLEQKFSLSKLSLNKPQQYNRHQSLPYIPKFQVEEADEYSSVDDFDTRSTDNSQETGLKPSEQQLFQTPPEWMNDENCYICHQEFGVFRHRHHCRNCGKSICRDHSAGKLMMPTKGFKNPQRVCTLCCATLLSKRSKSISSNQSDMDSIGTDTASDFCVSPKKSDSFSSSGEHGIRREEFDFLMAQINSLKQKNDALQQQVEILMQSKMTTQHQLLDQEEVQSKTMLLLTDTMTRVSVLELQSDDQEL